MFNRLKQSRIVHLNTGTRHAATASCWINTINASLEIPGSGPKHQKQNAASAPLSDPVPSFRHPSQPCDLPPAKDRTNQRSLQFHRWSPAPAPSVMPGQATPVATDILAHSDLSVEAQNWKQCRVNHASTWAYSTLSHVKVVFQVRNDRTNTYHSYVIHMTHVLLCIAPPNQLPMVTGIAARRQFGFQLPKTFEGRQIASGASVQV